MFTVTTGGCHSKHPTSFLMSRPRGLNEYLLLLVKTRAAFRISGSDLVIEPDSAVIIPPNTPYQYQSVSGDYMDDWLHFSFTDSDQWNSLELPVCSPIPLPDLSRFTLFIRQILWETNYDSRRFCAANVDLLMRLLFHNLSDAFLQGHERRRYSPYYTRLQSLRLAMQADPAKQYDPAKTAAGLGISTSYFQHLYTELFGASFQADQIRFRIGYARELLVHTNLTVRQIAEMCGYSNEVHFYRQFKKNTGMTPAVYRSHS